MKTNFGISLLMASAIVAGCKQKAAPIQNAEFEFERLVGRWEFFDNKTHQIEEWSMADEGHMNGKGFVLSDGDTTFIEFLEIEADSAGIVYWANAKNQNNGKAIPFKATLQTQDRIEFTNAEHDFPKKIVYAFSNENDLQAYIEGPRDGRVVRITFDFKRAASN